MELVCYNQKFALFGDGEQLWLRGLPGLELQGRLGMECRAGALQYGTGIAALVSQSKVRVWDFVYEREVYELESYLRVEKVALVKNLLVLISEERLLVHDLKSRTNQCYIPIQQGALAFVAPDYYRLRVAYYTESHMLANRQIWLNRVGRIEGVKFTLAAYSPDSAVVALALKNVLSLYHHNELTKVYGFDHEILELVPLADYFFLKLGDGQVIGCSLSRQVHFLEHSEVESDFWQSQYDTVLLADGESLFEVGRGLTKRYQLAHALDCSPTDSHTIKKSSAGEQE